MAGEAVSWIAQLGVFSWDEVDGGTETLVRNMEVRPSESVLDLGCAAGLVGLTAARRVGPTGQVSLVDVDLRAVESARRTLEINGLTNAAVLLSDVASAVLDRRFDVVLANPPFHQGHETDSVVAQQFIVDARTVLRPGGRLYLVANRFLEYERTLKAWFGAYRKIFEDSRFKVLLAIRPESDEVVPE